MKRRWVLTLIAAGVVAVPGCSGPTGDQSGAGAGGDSALRDAVEQPIERARAVEDISAGRKAGLDEGIEGASQ
jgi:hypothetical protein